MLAQPRFQVQPAGNVTVVEQSDGLVLVDAGGSPGAARRIVAAVRGAQPQAGQGGHHHPLARRPSAGVVGDPRGLAQARTIATRATQAHLRDPATMNTPAVLDPAAETAFQAQVDGFAAYAHDMAARASEPREASGWQAAERAFHQYARDMRGAVTLSTQEGFTERLAIPDRQAPVEIQFLGRANTDGDAVVWLPRQQVVVSGDMVVTPVPFGFGSYPGDWLATLARLRALPFRTLVPGHGPPQNDRARLDQLAAAIREIRAEVAPLAAQGLTLDDVRARVGGEAQLDAFGGADPWLRRWTREYWLRPLVASAYARRPASRSSRA